VLALFPIRILVVGGSLMHGVQCLRLKIALEVVWKSACWHLHKGPSRLAGAYAWR